MPKPYRKQLTFTVKTKCRECEGRGVITVSVGREQRAKALCVCVEVADA